MVDSHPTRQQQSFCQAPSDRTYQCRFRCLGRGSIAPAGALHRLAGSGTATLLLPSDLAGNLGRLQRLLHFAWKKTGVVRVRLARIPSADSIV